MTKVNSNTSHVLSWIRGNQYGLKRGDNGRLQNSSWMTSCKIITIHFHPLCWWLIHPIFLPQTVAWSRFIHPGGFAELSRQLGPHSQLRAATSQGPPRGRYTTWMKSPVIGGWFCLISWKNIDSVHFLPSIPSHPQPNQANHSHFACDFPLVKGEDKHLSCSMISCRPFSVRQHPAYLMLFTSSVAASLARIVVL